MRLQEQLATKKLDPTKILGQIKGWGGQIVGIGDVSEGLPFDLAGLSTGISLALIHPEQSQLAENQIYEYRYPEIDQKLEFIQKQISRQLRADGWRFLVIPTDTTIQENRFISKINHLFPHKTAATCAGLGWVGKSGLLINPQYGPQLSWATVLTNAPYEATGNPYEQGQCGKCSACVRACPAGAISGKEWTRSTSYATMINTAACAQQLELNRSAIGDLACGHCISVCRHSHSSKS